MKKIFDYYLKMHIGAATTALDGARLPVAPVYAPLPHAQCEHVVELEPRHSLCAQHVTIKSSIERDQ